MDFLGSFNSLENNINDISAYSNVCDICENRRYIDRSDTNLDMVKYQIYNLYKYMYYKGKEYDSFLKKSSSMYYLFKENESSDFGKIVINNESSNNCMELCLSLDCVNKQFLRLSGYSFGEKEQVFINGFYLDGSSPVRIVGSSDENGIFNICIANKDGKYLIKDPNFWHLFSVLSNAVISSKKLFEKPSEEVFAKIRNIMGSRGLREFYSDFFERYHVDIIDGEFSCEDFSNYLVSRALDKYLKGDDITCKKVASSGINVDVDDVKKFMDYSYRNSLGEVVRPYDYYPTFSNDFSCDGEVYSDFLRVLKDIPDSDVNMYVVGLAYFATYLYFGNDYRSNFSWLSQAYFDYKTSVAMKSSVLGVPVIDYARARDVDDGENNLIPNLTFMGLGFDYSKYRNGFQLTRCKMGEVNTDSFKKILPMNNNNVYNRTRSF